LESRSHFVGRSEIATVRRVDAFLDIGFKLFEERVAPGLMHAPHVPSRHFKSGSPRNRCRLARRIELSGMAQMPKLLKFLTNKFTRVRVDGGRRRLKIEKIEADRLLTRIMQS